MPAFALEKLATNILWARDLNFFSHIFCADFMDFFPLAARSKRFCATFSNFLLQRNLSAPRKMYCVTVHSSSISRSIPRIHYCNQFSDIVAPLRKHRAHFFWLINSLSMSRKGKNHEHAFHISRILLVLSVQTFDHLLEEDEAKKNDHKPKTGCNVSINKKKRCCLPDKVNSAFELIRRSVLLKLLFNSNKRWATTQQKKSRAQTLWIQTDVDKNAAGMASKQESEKKRESRSSQKNRLARWSLFIFCWTWWPVACGTVLLFIRNFRTYYAILCLARLYPWQFDSVALFLSDLSAMLLCFLFYLIS